jgi:hypothetical protein
MKTAFSLRPWPRRFALIFSSLGLLAGVVCGGRAGEPAAKPDAREAVKMVDALANHNKPPKVVNRPRLSQPGVVALYAESYDWKEEERVRRALERLYHDRTAELWEELVRREDDSRYCAVTLDVMSLEAQTRTVRSICHQHAYWCLVGVFQQHMPYEWGGRHARLSLDQLDKLGDWRKARRNKLLYEMQIEVGKMALVELAMLRKSRVERELVSKHDIDSARKKMQAELERLRRTKQPIFAEGPFSDVGPHECMYSEAAAREVRERVRSGYEGDLDVLRR